MNPVQNERQIWQKLGSVNSALLKNTLGQLHQAIAFVQAAGNAYVPKKADDSQSNMGWSVAEKALLGNEIKGKTNFRAGLNLAGFELVIAGESGAVVQSLTLDGKQRSDVLDWLREVLTAKGCDPDLLKIDLQNQMSEFSPPVDQAFTMEAPANFSEMAAYFSNAHMAIEEATADLPGASSVRCWPHHFDIASLVTVQDNPDPEKMKSIGVGLSPGDGSYSEPYFYVTPWPYPKLEKSDLPALKGGGFWHTDQWIGAVLKGSEISEQATAADQQKMVLQFLESAVQSCFVFLSLDL